MLRSNCKADMMNLDKANEAIDKALDFLYSNEKEWNTMLDLKLHDVAYEYADIMEEYGLNPEDGDYFSWFCNDSYDFFLDWMKEEGIADVRDYIGRTSKFYLTELHEYSSSKGELVLYFMEKYYGGYSLLDFDPETGHIIPDPEIGEGNETYDIEYIENELWRDIVCLMQDVHAIYEVITDFKEHQVEYFREFMEETAEAA